MGRMTVYGALRMAVFVVIGVAVVIGQGLFAVARLRDFGNLTVWQKLRAILDVLAAASVLMIGGAIGVGMLLAALDAP